MADRRLRVLVMTKGHPFQREPFFSLFDADPGLEWCHVEQPAASVFLDPERAADWDAYVLYDMPGVAFRRGEPPHFPDPPPALRSGLRALLDAGHGFVFLHHAIAGWPAWEGYAEIVGGRFHYRPGRLRGRDWPDSGYRFDVRHRLSPVDPTHPVVAGLEDGFELVDELYCAPVLEDSVVPLLRSDADFSPERFSSAALAVAGRRDSNEGWTHPQGSDLVAWARRDGASPIVYLQPGDGPSTYGSPTYRRLLGNAIRWVASPEAHRWAREGAPA